MFGATATCWQFGAAHSRNNPSISKWDSFHHTLWTGVCLVSLPPPHSCTHSSSLGQSFSFRPIQSKVKPLFLPFEPRLCFLVLIGWSQETAQVHHSNVMCWFESYCSLVMGSSQLPFSWTREDGREERKNEVIEKGFKKKGNNCNKMHEKQSGWRERTQGTGMRPREGILIRCD